MDPAEYQKTLLIPKGYNLKHKHEEHFTFMHTYYNEETGKFLFVEGREGVDGYPKMHEAVDQITLDLILGAVGDIKWDNLTRSW